MNFTQISAFRASYENKLAYPSYDLKKTNKDKYDKMKKAYSKESSDLYKLFKGHCKEAVDDSIGFELADAPFEAAFKMAWSLGHSAGYAEVAIYLDEICEVIEKTAESINQKHVEDMDGMLT